MFHSPSRRLFALFTPVCLFLGIKKWTGLRDNLNEIIGKNGRDCRAIPPLLQMHSKEGDREGTVHVIGKGAARGDTS